MNYNISISKVRKLTSTFSSFVAPALTRVNPRSSSTSNLVNLEFKSFTNGFRV